ncbi:MAG: tetratricopeptide repeat protein [Thermodesulfobacteriota bacterium]
MINNAYAHYILGVAHKAKGHLEKAISNFKSALKLHPACRAAKKYLDDAYELLDEQNRRYFVRSYLAE